LVDGPPLGVLGGGEAAEGRVGSVGEVLYSRRQASMTALASRRLPNSSMFRSSSRARPLKLSTKGFSHGVPGSM
jgi:hypothetical protein